MGPGSCCDTLDDHFGDWNWKKTVAFGMSLFVHTCIVLAAESSNLGPGLLCKLKIAVPEKNEHGCILEEMERALPASAVVVWRAQVELWESILITCK